MPRQYLVAIDGSLASRRALEYALELASDTGAEVGAVYVVMPQITFESGVTPPGAFAEPDQDLLQDVEDVERFGQSVLEEAAALAEREGFDLKTGLLSGNPDEEIADFATENDYDAVFVGHVDVAPRQESLFGSVAKDLVDSLEIPVTVVGA